MDDAEMCAERAAQEIERGGELWDVEQVDLVRLARLAWPDTAADVREPDEDDPLDVHRAPGEFRVWNPYEEDSVGLTITHPTKAHEAGLLVLRFLAGEMDMRAIVDAKAFGEAHDRAVAEHTRLLLLLEKRDHDLRVARASHEDTIREMNGMRDAANTLVAEMRAEYVMKSHDSGRCVSADRVDDWAYSIGRLILKEPGQWPDSLGPLVREEPEK